MFCSYEFFPILDLHEKKNIRKKVGPQIRFLNDIQEPGQNWQAMPSLHYTARPQRYQEATSDVTKRSQASRQQANPGHFWQAAVAGHRVKKSDPKLRMLNLVFCFFCFFRIFVYVEEYNQRKNKK